MLRERRERERGRQGEKDRERERERKRAVRDSRLTKLARILYIYARFSIILHHTISCRICRLLVALLLLRL
jgi:hypothetical protein